MSNNKKRNIIIGSLCAVVLLMTVGYAAFQAVLNIQGTSNITSSWNVKITKVESKNIVGTASNKVNPSWNNLTAEINANLESPGDSIEYDITVTNGGSLNAKLDKINISDSQNKSIKFTTSGIEEGDLLEAGKVAVIRIKIEYPSNITEQPSSDTATLEISLDYSQAPNGYTPPVTETAADKLIAKAVTSGDGLYADAYEEGRYIYRGGTPNNYITFNEENAGWRILSVEADGTLKIIKNESIGSKAWDTSNSNNWARPATLNTYLNNDYYNTLSSDAKNQIQSHSFGIGAVTYNDTNLGNTVTIENNTTWNGNIALATASEYVRTSNNSACTSVNAYWNTSSCYSNGSTHNWLTKIMNSSTYSWLLSPLSGYSYRVFYVHSNGGLNLGTADSAAPGLAPVLYLKSDIQLSGEGTQSKPYTIG
ncbi:MAG: DUF6273 domain-containing protein [Bacilli bacterium]